MQKMQNFEKKQQVYFSQTIEVWKFYLEVLSFEVLASKTLRDVRISYGNLFSVKKLNFHARFPSIFE